ncbi:hypothetical protein KDA_39100 [Dictyobacter alpinus]|uniref:Uncharacterized protein n=2 Tax=Dictyobacter alpinus TaxID=2014873 RepID=A0A402BAU7_9CHLR|nr:hypothetical protein KDA_39100 [Dictyobacter alpinus]
MILPVLFGMVRQFAGTEYFPKTANFDIFDILRIVISIVFMLPALFLEIGLTIGFINDVLRGNRPYMKYIQSLSTNEQLSREQV